MKLPPSLNLVAQAWREFFEAIPFTVTKDIDKHIDGLHSVYVQEITLRRAGGDMKLYYVGQSMRPTIRANAHKSELRRCKTTTFVGKSILYSPEVVKGLFAVDMHLRVELGGLSHLDAKTQEKRLAAALVQEHGAAVLTRP